MEPGLDKSLAERTNDSIELDRPVDYLIFTHTLISLKLDGAEQTIQVQISERINHQLTISTVEHIERLNISRGGNATLICPYRSKKLAFEIIIEDVSTENNLHKLECVKPKYGYLIDDRSSHRAKFNLHDNNLTAVIKAETIHGLVDFNTSSLIDYSTDTIAVSIDRSQGLLLPNDYIPKLQIYNENSDLLFEAAGEIFRVVYDDSDSQLDTYFSVIKLLDPNKRPAIDIHPNERRSERIAMQSDHNAFIEFQHPFTREKVSAYVTDLSNSGLSITINNGLYTLIPGLYISNAQLQLPLKARLSGNIKILGVSSTGDSESQLSKISMAFQTPSSELSKEINSFVQKSISEKLEDAKGVDYNSLWEFFFESGFIYENKRRQIQKYSDEIRRTQKILLHSDSPLCKTIVYKENDNPMGTGTALKIYDGTLLLQHLNAKTTHANSGAAAKAIIRGMTTFFLDESTNKSLENKYVCTYFRPDNLFPALVFGESSKLINNKDISWVKQYKFCVMRNDVNYANISYSDIEVHEADSDDLAMLEKLLIRQERFRIFKLEDLSREGIVGMRLFDEYRKLGLYHYRRVFISKDHNSNDACYAVCTYSSPGMNLSELTNSVKFYFTTQDQNVRGGLINAITPAVIDSYSQTDMQSPVMLLDEGTPVPFGYKHEKIYALWAMDLNYPKLYKESVEMIFGDIKHYIRNAKVS